MVNTPNASLSVRGTVFNVYCDGENTAVIVTEGTVWGTNGSGEEVVIEAGNGADLLK